MKLKKYQSEEYIEMEAMYQLFEGAENTMITELLQDYFEDIGFVWEDFGSHSIAMRQMPVELYGKSEKRFYGFYYT